MIASGDRLAESGKYELALSAYYKALETCPDKEKILVKVASMFIALDKPDQAIPVLHQAISILPEYTYAHFMLGKIYLAQHRLDQASQHLKQAINPLENHHEAGFMLINVLQMQNHHGEATEVFRFLMPFYPEDAALHHNYAYSLNLCNKTEEAIQHYKAALKINPDLKPSLINLGNIYLNGGHQDEAEPLFRSALRVDPHDYIAHYSLGIIAHEREQHAEALKFYQAAIQLSPGLAQAYVNMAIIHDSQGNVTLAEKNYLEALQLQPGLEEANVNVGAIYKQKGNLALAADYFKRALQKNPDLYAAHVSLGSIYKELGNPQMAIEHCERALLSKPNSADAYNNLAAAMMDTGNLEAAIDCYRKAMQHKPEDFAMHSNLILCLQYSSRHTNAEIDAELEGYASKFEAPLRTMWAKHTNPPLSNRKLKIGYVSPDFRSHSVAYFIEPVLLNHARKQYEIFCYYNNSVQDEFNKRLRSLADHWLDCAHLPAQELSDRIRNDQIDILVDLAGHTSNNSLMVFARKPAPIQISYIGYPASTGLSAIDYRITDLYVDPIQENQRGTPQAMWHLPGIYSCYQPPQHAPQPIQTPPLATNGYITFGCLNNFTKLSDHTLELWSSILHKLPESRLLLKINGIENSDTRMQVESKLERFNLPYQRLILIGKQPSNPYELYKQIDICLDPFPYNGCTTSFDSLWMGVPFITLSGDRSLSRVGCSILSNLGLTELIAGSPEQYSDIAIALGRNAGALLEIRLNLRERMLNSPLTDARALTSNLEAAYMGMWDKWWISQSQESHN